VRSGPLLTQPIVNHKIIYSKKLSFCRFWSLHIYLLKLYCLIYYYSIAKTEIYTILYQYLIFLTLGISLAKGYYE
jgi:hypothetical protein